MMQQDSYGTRDNTKYVRHKYPYSGIYIITNKRTKKSYVGQSGNVYRRRKQHFSALKSGKHENWLLQFEFNMYGARSFEWKVLEWCNPADLNAREKYWIKTLDTMAPNGFNLDWVPYQRKQDHPHTTAKTEALKKEYKRRNSRTKRKATSTRKRNKMRRINRPKPCFLERTLDNVENKNDNINFSDSNSSNVNSVTSKNP